METKEGRKEGASPEEEAQAYAEAYGDICRAAEPSAEQGYKEGYEQGFKDAAACAKEQAQRREERAARNPPKVENMLGRSGKPVPNQHVITYGDAVAFQSYAKTIAIKQGGLVYLDRGAWDYSHTTSKYRVQFLGQTKKQTLRAIEEGKVILTDLNGRGGL